KNHEDTHDPFAATAHRAPRSSALTSPSARAGRGTVLSLSSLGPCSDTASRESYCADKSCQRTLIFQCPRHNGPKLGHDISESPRRYNNRRLTRFPLLVSRCRSSRRQASSPLLG